MTQIIRAESCATIAALPAFSLPYAQPFVAPECGWWWREMHGRKPLAWGHISAPGFVSPSAAACGRHHFGKQHSADASNPRGTAKVLAACRDLGIMTSEAALAIELFVAAGPAAADVVNKAVCRFVEQGEAGTWKNPAPIGFFFAKLWYFEKLYPIIFTVAALGRTRLVMKQDF